MINTNPAKTQINQNDTFIRDVFDDDDDENAVVQNGDGWVDVLDGKLAGGLGGELDDRLENELVEEWETLSHGELES